MNLEPRLHLAKHKNYLGKLIKNADFQITSLFPISSNSLCLRKGPECDFYSNFAGIHLESICLQRNLRKYRGPSGTYPAFSRRPWLIIFQMLRPCKILFCWFWVPKCLTISEQEKLLRSKSGLKIRNTRDNTTCLHKK